MLEAKIQPWLRLNTLPGGFENSASESHRLSLG
jgi:hypothetical protein